MKRKTIKYILIAAFLFFLAYMNKDKIPTPVELKTFDFIISSGIDIDLNSNSNKFSISYISSEETNDKDNKSNENKNIFNVKSDTMNSTIKKIQNLTNKSLSDSHLEYMLIGEETAKNSLDYLIDYYSRNQTVRLDVKMFITKDITSEDFIEKILTSKINVDARLDGLVNNKSQLSSIAKKDLKDIMQLFYSKEKNGFIPALSVKESPVKSENEEENESEEKKYTFEFYGLGIIKDGKLTEYLPHYLVRSYFILTKNLKMPDTDIEITDENNNLYVFSVKNSKNKTSFKFDEYNNPKKVIFNISLETKFIETNSKNKNIENSNNLQSDKIKSEIEEIIEISKNSNADFLNIGEILSVMHPYKWHDIKDDWQDIFKNLEYEINVSVQSKGE